MPTLHQPGYRPWDFGLQLWYYADSPSDFGEKWQIRLVVKPVIALPW